MTEFRDLSKLPVDSAYWDDLEARIMAELGPRVRQGVVTRAAWWLPLAARAGTLGALAAAACMAALLLLPARAPAGGANPVGVLRVPEHDPAITAFVSAPAPPSLGSLILPSQGSTR